MKKVDPSNSDFLKKWTQKGNILYCVPTFKYFNRYIYPCSTLTDPTMLRMFLPTIHSRTTMVRTFASKPKYDMEDLPGNDLWTFLKAYKDVRSTVRGGGQSFAHNLYTALALEVVRTRVDSEFQISDVLEGSAHVTEHVAHLINKQHFNAISNLCLAGPGRDSQAIKDAILSYGLTTRDDATTNTDASFQCEVMGTPMLEALQFDFVGYEGISLHPTSRGTIIDEITEKAAGNVREIAVAKGLAGLGDCMMLKDVMITVAVYVPCSTKMLSTKQSEYSLNGFPEPLPLMEGWDNDNIKTFLDAKREQIVQETAEIQKLNFKNNVEDDVAATDEDEDKVEEEEEEEEEAVGPFWHHADGCRIVMQTTATGSEDDEFNWDLIHVDMGVIRFQDVEPL